MWLVTQLTNTQWKLLFHFHECLLTFLHFLPCLPSPYSQMRGGDVRKRWVGRNRRNTFSENETLSSQASSMPVTYDDAQLDQLSVSLQINVMHSYFFLQSCPFHMKRGRPLETTGVDQRSVKNCSVMVLVIHSYSHSMFLSSCWSNVHLRVIWLVLVSPTQSAAVSSAEQVFTNGEWLSTQDALVFSR